jgi:hypothetical protein
MMPNPLDVIGSKDPYRLPMLLMLTKLGYAIVEISKFPKPEMFLIVSVKIPF